MCDFPVLMLEYVNVCWVYDVNTFSLAYPLLVCMIVCGFLLCDDHQPYWCEQTWEPLTMVTIIEMPQFDEILDVYRAHFGEPQLLEFSSNSFSRTWRDSVLRVGHVGPFPFVMNMLGYCVRHIPNFCTLWIFLYVAFYLNWFYPFNWDIIVIK